MTTTIGTTTIGTEEMIDGRRLTEVGQSPHIAVNCPRQKLTPERLSKTHRPVGSPVEAQPLARADFGHVREADTERAVSTRPCDMMDAAEGVLGVALVAQPARKVLSNRDNMLPQTDESHEPNGFVVRTLPSGKKLRTSRAGRCRSLISPNNKVFSSTVVARVKLGFQNGDDEKRPKVLIVGSGTFNPIHKVHIRRFHLARNFLQVQKGVSKMYK